MNMQPKRWPKLGFECHDIYPLTFLVLWGNRFQKLWKFVLNCIVGLRIRKNWLKIVEMLLQRTFRCDKYRRSFPGLRTRWVWNAGANPNYTFLSMNLHRHSQVIQLIPDTSLFQCISDMPNQFNLAFRGLTNNTFLKDGSKMIGFSFHRLEYLNFIDIVVANMIIFRHCHFCPSEWSIVEYSNHSWQLSHLQQFTSKLKKAHSGSFENVEWFGRTGDQKHYSS